MNPLPLLCLLALVPQAQPAAPSHRIDVRPLPGGHEAVDVADSRNRNHTARRLATSPGASPVRGHAQRLPIVWRSLTTHQSMGVRSSCSAATGGVPSNRFRQLKPSRAATV